MSLGEYLFSAHLVVKRPAVEFLSQLKADTARAQGEGNSKIA